MLFGRIAIVLSLVLVAALAAQERPPKPRPESRFGTHIAPAAIAALQCIRPENIETHVRFLSNDLLEGRWTGQRGGDIAAQYIAAQFALAGLKPAGDNGSYLQKVPMVGVTPTAETRFTLVPAKGQKLDLKPLDDYVAYDQTQQPESNIDAEIVYVGYGIEAPEYHWDDYKGVDVKGKVLLMLVNQPPSDDPKFFTGKALTYYGRWVYKYEEAARKGASGAILIHKTEMASYPWDVVRNSFSGEKAFLKLDGSQQLKAASWIQLDVARKLFAASGLDIDKMMAAANSRDFKPVPLHARLSARMRSRIRPFESNNVIAMLPGSDRVLKDEGVIYTAHYDHLGIRPDMPGDNIYNGAMDNATGCGILMEIARVYGASAKKPRRSIYFGQSQAKNRGCLVLNIWASIRLFPRAGSRSVSTSTRSYPWARPKKSKFQAPNAPRSFLPCRRRRRISASRFVPTPTPKPDITIVPIISASPASAFHPSRLTKASKFKGHDEAWGLAQEDDFTKHHYHQPSDEYHPGMDYTSDAAMARFGFALGWEAANQTQMVDWKKGDEFEKARQASQLSLPQ